MNERERWIIYPLLFFALGAALRDKFTQQVTTDRLHAGKIYCEELEVIDSEKPDRIVAKLSSNPPQRDNPNADRYGVFLLIDSEGKELCGVTNNQLQVSRIACNAVTVLDPKDPNRVLALLTAAEAAKPDGTTRRLGSLLLTDNEGVRQFGLADDQLSMRQIVCEGVAVVNPENRGQVLAALGSVAVQPEGEGAKSERFGVLALNNEQFGSLHGNPPKRPLENQPPRDPAEGDDERPAEGAGADQKPAASDEADTSGDADEPAKTPADAPEQQAEKA
ncbi:hypothetical protein [Lacipirellula limnantheis]|uniref:Uncharacterized protein n=1 Tax=Lacipirellula limnantheis TaxID=2528024 RepID=A0A517U5E0_9BACT|nr:hypothetical protein [Lacipirellula limnantheis]QDT75854.1 hypothetical protein I41_50970 [Lacipirellula limnantheis]